MQQLAITTREVLYQLIMMELMITLTELIGCTFINCHHTIYQGGELTIKNCKALFNSFNDAVDTDYPAFLTAYDGTVEITHALI